VIDLKEPEGVLMGVSLLYLIEEAEARAMRLNRITIIRFCILDIMCK
jgi:hypothetical protein